VTTICSPGFVSWPPPTPSASIRRWSLRRVVLTMAVRTGPALAFVLVAMNLGLAGLV
jgi:hypothetical protein